MLGLKLNHVSKRGHCSAAILCRHVYKWVQINNIFLIYVMRCYCVFYLCCIFTCYDWRTYVLCLVNALMCHVYLSFISNLHTYVFHQTPSVRLPVYVIFHLHLSPPYMLLNSLKLMLFPNWCATREIKRFVCFYLSNASFCRQNICMSSKKTGTHFYG